MTGAEAVVVLLCVLLAVAAAVVAADHGRRERRNRPHRVRVHLGRHRRGRRGGGR